MKIAITIIISLTLQLANAQSFYKLEAKTIDGETFKFEQLRGKTVMIVNTASKCGYTPQFEDLEKLFKEYKGNDFVIFQMMEKIKVKGKNMHPVYKWLTKKEKNSIEDSKIKWNFQKYIIDKNGNLVAIFKPRVKPFDNEVLQVLKEQFKNQQ